jgi:protein-S-isoprenylcysteine O-methyltransferase Ste14
VSAWLEHRIPPPVVGAVVAAGMWVLASRIGLLSLPDFGLKGVLTGLLVALGLAFDLAGLRAFLARRTTVNPLRPERASSLVTEGVYRVTRNPMYIGMVFLLLAWGLYLADAAALLLGPACYVLYLNRFQIGPEERVLLGLFGNEYRTYMARVRRWL